MNSQQFDDIIKNSAQQREADVTPDIWEEINKGKKKRRRFPFFWFILLGLTLGVTGIVWNLNNTKENIPSASVEQKNNSNQAIAAEQVTEKNELSINMHAEQEENNSIDPDKIVPNKDALSNTTKKYKTGTSSKNKITTITTQTRNTTFNQQQQKIPADKIVNSSKEELLTKTHNKRKIAGNSKLTISAGQTNAHEPDISIENETTVAVKHLKRKTRKALSITIRAADQDSLLNSATAAIVDPATTNNKEEDIQTDLSDSLLSKNNIPEIKDSLLVTKKENIAATQKKQDKKKTATTLKIEVGLTAILPVQQYNLPLYVQRNRHTDTTQSEFISKSIHTTVETGAAFNLVIIKDLNKKWSAGFGVQYLQFTERLHFSGIETTKTNRLVKRLVTDPGGSYLKTDTIIMVTRDSTIIRGRNIYSNISLPLFARYNIVSRKKWAVSFTAGIYIDLLRKYQDKLPGKFETMYTSGLATDSKLTMGVDAFAGLHVTGILWKKIEWFAEPGFRYSFSNYGNNNLPFNKKIHKAGLSVGIAFPFK